LIYAKWYDQGIPINITIGNTTILRLDPIKFDGFIAWEKYDWLFHVLIPILAITILGLALYTRLVRGGMLEIMRQDYILSARASGFSEKVIVNKHALRNVLIPVITILGLSIGSILGGAPITETVISWPGLGRYALFGLLASDYSVIMATYMIVAFMTLFANLITDIMYSVIDPRVRIE
jgi:peptide/nickel transport system permease protein